MEFYPRVFSAACSPRHRVIGYNENFFSAHSMTRERIAMSPLLDSVSSYLNDDNVARISESLGADRDQTQKAIGAALPTLLGALGRNASDEQGREKIHQALLRDHDGSLLDNLGSFLGPGPNPSGNAAVSSKTTSGSAIVDHILGGRKSRIESGISQASGLSSGQSSQLMSMLGPLVMGALGKKQKQEGLSAGGLGEMLQSEGKQLESSSFAGGILGKMFDQDGDGDFDMMDIVHVGIGRFFKR